MNETNLQIRLARRPEGAPQPGDFSLVETAPPDMAPGEVLVRHRYLSLDPYMRGRMDDAKSYAAAVGLGEVMQGQSVGQVVASTVPGFAPGDWVLGGQGWQRLSAVPAGGLLKLDPEAAPLTAWLGVLGMPGTTAWVGTTRIAVPRPGETFVVSAASGAVGSVAGQIAKRMGARVVGIAGGPEKCAFVTDTLGFDDGVDHRAEDFPARLAAACPEGIDVYFENVGGAVQHAVWPLLRDFGRVAFCGMVAEYNTRPPAPGPSLMQVVRKRLSLRGFIVMDHPDAFAEWRRTGARWLREGALQYREDVVQGLEKAPDAFLGLLGGKNFGKLIVAID
ncbi:NADP-dependent oxidoreductase [Roseomonas sp. OT10]|uniref:NADP-dependent oxidoreductase n=1 Tax=Roseomonas cutis TaxID=2897332 RepID=UPI001E5A97A6|nr:NADP-dependent oxidoreductase [Roseomonas sp. OT10]UFN49879.1 NADP-dependent oxidoreductase [Roseomonas sp. OT10]